MPQNQLTNSEYNSEEIDVRFYTMGISMLQQYVYFEYIQGK